jgi:hypothetical protein
LSAHRLAHLAILPLRCETSRRGPASLILCSQQGTSPRGSTRCQRSSRISYQDMILRDIGTTAMDNPNRRVAKKPNDPAGGSNSAELTYSIDDVRTKSSHKRSSRSPYHGGHAPKPAVILRMRRLWRTVGRLARWLYRVIDGLGRVRAKLCKIFGAVFAPGHGDCLRDPLRNFHELVTICFEATRRSL